MSTGHVTLDGAGLHSGRPCAVTFARSPGDLVFRTANGEAKLSELDVVRADRGVRVRVQRIGLDVDSVEHLLAALGGLGIRRGVAIEVSGGEVPLADGAALKFAEALASLGLPTDPPSLTVAHPIEWRVGQSTYRFEPEDAPALEVEVAFDAPAIGVELAIWDGTPEAFVRDVAWARTFGFRRDGGELLLAGRARGVDRETVMVLDDHGRVEAPGAPARPAEFARHKLLDLVGDLYLFGGPPRGRLRATRPGHAATHRAITEALAAGSLVSTNGAG